MDQLQFIIMVAFGALQQQIDKKAVTRIALRRQKKVLTVKEAQFLYCKTVPADINLENIQARRMNADYNKPG